MKIVQKHSKLSLITMASTLGIMSFAPCSSLMAASGSLNGSLGGSATGSQASGSSSLGSRSGSKAQVQFRTAPLKLAQVKVTQQKKAQLKVAQLKLAQAKSTAKTTSATNTASTANTASAASTGSANTTASTTNTTSAPSSTTTDSAATTTGAGSSSLSLGSVTTPEKKSKFSGGWLGALSTSREIEFDGTVEKSNTSSNKMTGLLGVRLGYNITEEMKLSFGLNSTFASGFILVSEESKGKPTENTLSAMEAAVSYKFNDHLSTKLGITRQFTLLHSPVVIGKSAWPTARIQISSGEKDDNKIGLIAQGAIVTSTNLTAKNREEDGTPSMASAALTANAKISSLEIAAKASGFQFSNLTSATAKAAEGAGNSVVTRIGATPTEVIHGFKTGIRGIDGTLDLGLELSKSFKYNLGGSYTKNLEAEEGLGVGTSVDTSLEVTLSDNLVLKPYYSRIKIEPDATVASFGYFNTNKMGYDAGLKATIAKTFSITAGGSETDMVYIKNDTYYGRAYYLMLETELIPF